MGVMIRAAVFALLQAVQIPAPTGLVNDFAHALQPATAARIEAIAADVRNKSRGEITVVTLPDIGTNAVEDVALQIGRQWKVGKIGNPGDPTRNAGAVILLVPKETSSDGRGHCYIATGRGAEGFITDGDAGDICREATPAFRARDYDTGIELVTLRTAQRFANEFHFTLDTAVSAEPVLDNGGDARPTRGGSFPPQLIFVAIFLVMGILSRIGSRGRRRSGCGGCLPIFIPTGGRGGWGGAASVAAASAAVEAAGLVVSAVAAVLEAAVAAPAGEPRHSRRCK